MQDFEKITSRENERLKRARRIRDSKETQFMFVEGVRLCIEALRSRISVEEVFVSDKFENAKTLDLLQNRQASIFELPERLLASIADTKSPQGLVLIAQRPQNMEVATVFARTKEDAATSIFVYLNEINNPSNLGAVIRTAEAAGVSAVITSHGSADAFSAKALRASMGSAFRVPVVASANFNETVNSARKNGIQVIAVDSKADTSYADLNWELPSLLVFGSEAAGLSKEILNAADETISIPMRSPVESLNLAVSCGIVLFEARRKAK